MAKKKATAKRKAAKKKTATKRAKRVVKKGKRGKRYSSAQKAKIIAFVEKVNAEKGRGGVAQASRKFGVSQLTIHAWIKKGGKPVIPRKKPTIARRKGARGRRPAGGDVLDQLVAIRADIQALENELSAKQAQFEKLKRKL